MMNKIPLILVVDDDYLLQRATLRILDQAGYRTCHASDGLGGLQMARDQKPDLTLLDVNLPDISGVEVCRLIKNDKALGGCFVVLLSGSRIDSQSQVDGLEGGADGYIPRPVANAELLARVRGMLRIQQAEKSLMESEKRYRTVADFTHDWEAWRGPDGAYLYISPSCERISGHTSAEFLVDPDLFMQITHSQDRIMITEHYRAVSQELQKQDMEIDFRIITPGGENRWIRHSCTAVYGEDGTWLGRRESNRDITERKLADERIRELANELQGTLDTVTAGISHLKDRKVVWANHAHDEIFGYVIGESQGLATSVFYPDQESFEQLGQAAYPQLLQGKTFTDEWEMRKKDGTLIWCSLNGRLVNAAKPDEGSIWMIQDITERKQSELALLASEAKLQMVLDNSHDAIGLHVNGFWRMCNPATLQLFGVASEQELIGTSILNVIAPIERARILDYVSSRIQGNVSPSAYLTRGLRCDGSEFDMEVTLSTFILLGELNVLVILHDITERKRNDDLLRESERRFRHLADSVPALIWQAGTDSLCDFFNKPWLEYSGRTIEQEMGNGWTEGVHPDDYQKCVDIYLSAFEKRELFSMEYRLRRFDGEYRWLLDTGVPRFTAQGIFLGYIGACVDISVSKHLEIELQAQRDFANTIINTMGQGLTVSDADGRFVFINSAYARLLRYEPEQLIGRHPKDLTALEDQGLLDEQKKQRMDGKTSTYESHLLRADGSTAPVLITGVPRVHADSEYYSGAIAVITDLTEQKVIENELRTAKQALEQALIREQKLSQTDGLTGINNRRYLFELAERELAVAARYEQPLAVIMFDIDHFKQVNDVFGHDIGDQILKSAIQTVCAELRTSDVIGRYGGEEFIILLPMTNAQQAYPLAERIRTSVAGMGVPSEKGNVSVTLSIGIVEMSHDSQTETVEDLFRRADKAMYSAKFTGRNRTIILDTK